MKQEDILNIVIDDMNNIKSLYDDTETKPIVLFPDYSKIITNVSILSLVDQCEKKK